MSPTWVTFLFEAANFLVLAALLGWLFFRPVRDAIERRRAALEAEQRQAAAALADVEKQREEVAAQRREIEQSLAALRERVREEAERERAGVVAAGREQAEREREALAAELRALRRGGASAVAGDAAAAAREIAASLLRTAGGGALDAGLFAAARRSLAELARQGPLAPVIVETPGPAPEAGLAALAQAAGLPVSELQQRQVPELMGGVRVLTARGLVDASVAGFAAHAEQALLGRIEAEEDGGA